MQNLTKLIADTKRKAYLTDQHILNMIREYLQILILKAIYQSEYGRGLSFIGGTCLRICYDLKRYSEDLDFALDRSIPAYSFVKLNKRIQSFLKSTDFEVDLGIREDKTVQKSFIKVSKVLHLFGISPLKTQNLHIKLEIDTNPVRVNRNELETFFVTKFNENFPILKHTDETMFAGKIGAVLNRTYTKGRDFYDLLWYLNRRTKINLKYLNRSQKQAGLQQKFTDQAGVIQAITTRVAAVKADAIIKDIGRFLEEPAQEKILKNYPTAFKQATDKYLKPTL